MPYLHDQGSDVINGTFKRNCNSTPALKWLSSFKIYFFRNIHSIYLNDKINLF
jgi:hypothetical protein